MSGNLRKTLESWQRYAFSLKEENEKLATIAALACTLARVGPDDDEFETSRENLRELCGTWRARVRAKNLAGSPDDDTPIPWEPH